MESLNLYPRGFMTRAGVSISDTAGVGINLMKDGSPDLNMILKLYEGRTINTDRWAFRKRAIACCSTLFGDFEQWLELQLIDNNFVQGLAVDFLEDTVSFIRTGRRMMSVQSWHDLLLEFPEEVPGIASRERLARFNLTNHKEFDNYLGEWAGQPDGFVDILWTARVLFGGPKKALETHLILKP